jgi:hypothetical protein
MLSGPDSGPGLLLDIGGLSDLFLKPTGNQRMKLL